MSYDVNPIGIGGYDSQTLIKLERSPTIIDYSLKPRTPNYGINKPGIALKNYQKQDTTDYNNNSTGFKPAVKTEKIAESRLAEIIGAIEFSQN